MPRKLTETLDCRRYLINSFVHPLIARLFTTWEQVRKFDNGASFEAALKDDEAAIALFNNLKHTIYPLSIIDNLDNI